MMMVAVTSEVRRLSDCPIRSHVASVIDEHYEVLSEVRSPPFSEDQVHLTRESR